VQKVISEKNMKRPVLRASAVRNPVRVLVILSVVLGLLALLLVKGLKGPQARIAGLAMDGDEDARATATQLEMDGVDVHELIKVLKTSGLLLGKSPPALPSTQLEGMTPEEAKDSFKRGPFGGRGYHGMCIEIAAPEGYDNVTHATYVQPFFVCYSTVHDDLH